MLLVPSFGNFFVFASFKLNQQEIADTICVQRKLLVNNCNGRCELQKSLKKYADNERKMQDSLKEKAEVIYIQNSIADYPLSVIVKQHATQNFASFDKKPISVANVAFHPPSLFI